MNSEPAPPPLRTDLEFVVRQGRPPSFVVHAPSGGYIRLNHATLRLLQALDGTSGLGALARRTRRRRDEVARVVAAAKAAGLLQPEGSREGALTNSEPPNSLSHDSVRVDGLRFKVLSFDPTRVLEGLDKTMAPLFSVGGLVTLGTALLVAVGALLGDRTQLAASMTTLGWFQNWALVLPLLVMATVVHELGHATACRRFGGDVREAGLMIYLFQPMAFANISTSWMFPSARQRIAVSLAGVYLEAYLLCISVFVWWLTPPYELPNQIAFVALMAIAVRILANLYPLLRLDGYWVLCDLLGVTNLRQKSSFHLLCLLPLQTQWRWRRRPDRRERRIFVTYGVLAGASVCGAIVGMAAALWFWLGEVAGGRTTIFLAVVFGATVWAVIACVKGVTRLAAQYGRTGATSGKGNG